MQFSRGLKKAYYTRSKEHRQGQCLIGYGTSVNAATCATRIKLVSQKLIYTAVNFVTSFAWSDLSLYMSTCRLYINISLITMYLYSKAYL